MMQFCRKKCDNTFGGIRAGKSLCHLTAGAHL